MLNWFSIFDGEFLSVPLTLRLFNVKTSRQVSVKCVLVAVGRLQGKSRFTVAESESRNSTVAEGGILVPNMENFKR